MDGIGALYSLGAGCSGFLSEVWSLLFGQFETNRSKSR